jgi:hypothetical protein
MKKVLPISNPRFPQKTFAVFAIIALVAYLLSIRKVAEVVKSGVEMLGINFPNMDLFMDTANTIKEVAIGVGVLIVAAAVAVLSVKAALFVVAGAIVVFGAYKLYNTFFGKPNYGDTDLTKK